MGVTDWYNQNEAGRLCRSLLASPQRSPRRRIMRMALLHMLANLGFWLGWTLHGTPYKAFKKTGQV